MKRRMESLPPIDFSEYEMINQTLSPTNDLERKTRDNRAELNSCVFEAPITVTDSSDAEDDDDDIILPSPNECLFCPVVSGDIDGNLTHMTATHGFRIANIEKLATDLDTFIAYLALVVRGYFSCLYCGHTKHSAEAIQAHMVDKGHCMLDMSSDSEYLDFWETDNYSVRDDMFSTAENLSINTPKVSDTEMRLPSGAIASNRHSARWMQSSRGARAGDNGSSLMLRGESPGTTPITNPEQLVKDSNSQELAGRDQMGVIGLSDQQRRNLVAIGQKIRSRELRSKSARYWALEKGTNRQKHFKVGRMVLASHKLALNTKT